MRPHYSGDKSTKFWKRVNRLSGWNHDRWSHVYELGCILQEMEGRVIRALEDCERSSGVPSKGGGQ